MEVPKLIFDIGMHNGQDTKFFLHNKAKVVAVDADPKMIENAQSEFSNFIDTNQLVLVNKAIGETEGQELNFYLSNHSIWNSIDSTIAAREMTNSENPGNEFKNTTLREIKVQSTTLKVLMEEYGVPYYCKIDIEGMDNSALQSLKNSKSNPLFISVETECITENNKFSEEASLNTLYSLQALGYTKFMLIDQASLQPLALNKIFYSETKNQLFYYLNRVFGKMDISIYPIEYRRKLKYYNFSLGASGPYGEMLRGDWYSFSDAAKLLVRHRNDYFKLSNAVGYGFWCDWHATF